MADIRIGDEVYIHGFVDEVRKDTVIIKNEGGYFGTVADEIMPPVQPEPLWGKTVEVERPLADIEIVSRLRAIQKQVGGSYAIDRAIEIIEAVASAQPERKPGEAMIEELKPCPFRIHGEKTMSPTISGEYTYNETFMPCMGSKCLCYRDEGDEIKCYRDNLSFTLLDRRLMR